MRFGAVSIRDDQDIFARMDGIFGFLAEFVKSFEQSSRLVISVEMPKKLDSTVAFVFHVLDFLQVFILEDWLRNMDLLGVLRRFFEDVVSFADACKKRHHHPFPNRIDRRIAHLRK